MNLKLEKATKWLPIEQQYECKIVVRIGEREMFVVGRGHSEADAELAAEASFKAACERLDHVNRIERRGNRINWWAAEHSKEHG